LIAGGLLVDQVLSCGQHLVDLILWLFFFWLIYQSERVERYQLLVCLGFATLGEIVFSDVWHLYDYRLGHIPLFVPPGHTLLYTLGRDLTRFISFRVIAGFLVITIIISLYLLLDGSDTISFLWLPVFMLCMMNKRGRKLYAVMFVLALLMEIYGTWLGNWAWRPIVPGLGFTSNNPPFSVGVFYCVLDLLVISVTSHWGKAVNQKSEIESGKAESNH